MDTRTVMWPNFIFYTHRTTLLYAHNINIQTWGDPSGWLVTKFFIVAAPPPPVHKVRPTSLQWSRGETSAFPKQRAVLLSMPTIGYTKIRCNGVTLSVSIYPTTHTTPTGSPASAKMLKWRRFDVTPSTGYRSTATLGQSLTMDKIYWVLTFPYAPTNQSLVIQVILWNYYIQFIIH